jgi:hypothetical protein
MTTVLTLGMFVFGSLLFMRYFVELLAMAMITLIATGTVEIGLFKLLTCVLGLVLMFQPW